MTPAERKDVQAFHESYLRLREMLAPWGAMHTKHGGSDRFEKTELALHILVADYTRHVALRRAVIAALDLV